MFRNAMIISLLVLSTPIASAIAAGPKRHAVIIGINDYADAAIPDLKYAEADAQSVYDTLTDARIGQFPKKNVTLLLGKKAAPSNIKAALWKLRGVGKKDLVVVFYSGHGAKEGDEAFWVTQNAQAKALPATALSNADIRKYLARIPSQKLVTFLDCCYAASTVKKSLSDPAKLFGKFAGKGRVTIAGSADSQEALEMPSAKAGVFTHFLVRALSGSADSNEDGAVTFGEVWSYLGQNVRKASVKQGGLLGRVLHPLQEEPQPAEPVAFEPNGIEAVVVLLAVLLEEEAQVEQRLGQRPLSTEDQRDQQPAQSAVAVEKRVDRLELHVR